MRGLKRQDLSLALPRPRSHLLQMRGLKPSGSDIADFGQSRIFYRCVDWNFIYTKRHLAISVASFTDAWIETRPGMDSGRQNQRRIFYRCVDWNLPERKSFFAMPSHLLQMRGLKLRLMILTSMLIFVASFTDAWIETNKTYSAHITVKSHLLQMRGLKRRYAR